ncbi:MAG: hypothetical protein M3O15_08630 [Acidobacteriota bacterium]|nr:hypothetical protein [Acidobacteriota bacterium]
MIRVNRASLRYSWLTYRRDQLWFPPVVLAIFAVILLVMRHPAIRFNIARAYLGFIVPLIGGIMAAYAVLDDPALELCFATPVRPEQILLDRVGLILAIQAACAVVFQLLALSLGVSLSPLGGVLGAQLAWLLPALTLTALGTAGSLAGAQTMTGAFMVGGVWLVELMTKRWFELNARYLYIFMGVLVPGHPDLVINRCVLAVVALALLLFAWVLLHRQERYI